MTTFIFSFMIISFGMILGASISYDLEGKQHFIEVALDYYTPTLQITDFTLLTLSICFLVCLLRQMSAFEEQKGTFVREICTLIIILIIFDISYILRLCFDLCLSHLAAGGEEPGITFFLITMFIPIIFDIFPVSLILYIHSRNFKHDQNDHNLRSVSISESETMLTGGGRSTQVSYILAS